MEFVHGQVEFVRYDLSQSRAIDVGGHRHWLVKFRHTRGHSQLAALWHGCRFWALRVCNFAQKSKRECGMMSPNMLSVPRAGNARGFFSFPPGEDLIQPAL
jgi:hypothetical protein